MTRLKIGIDLDETINDFVRQLLSKYNLKYHDNLQLEDITQYDISLFTKKINGNIFTEFCNNEFILNLNLDKNAKNVINLLHKKHDIYFVTAAFPETVMSRHIWLKKHFPWYDYSMLIVCKDKYLLDLDILVDDYENNLVKGNYMKILVDKPWNKCVNNSDIIRIGNITELLELVEDKSKKVSTWLTYYIYGILCFATFLITFILTRGS